MVQSLGQALETLEKQAYGRGHPWPEGVDVHDPRRVHAKGVVQQHAS